MNDGQLTQACGRDADPNVACGDYAVNTIQPTNAAARLTAPQLAAHRRCRYPNIGDRLSAKNISWNWYSGGWNDAAAGHPGPLFQYHHQPLNYFANYAPGQPGRAHLKDETDFMAAAKNGTLPTVSFVKPYGAENEHPGYASEPDGSDHLVDLLKTILYGPRPGHPRRRHLRRVRRSMGPRPAPTGARGVVRQVGPRHPDPGAHRQQVAEASGVDHTLYDTTSILATIEHGFHLAPLGTRDAAVADLRNALVVGSNH